ncbi:MAG: SBBP repeat-containing protein [Candidatus Hodarchaeota archaeon]
MGAAILLTMMLFNIGMVLREEMPAISNVQGFFSIDPDDYNSSEHGRDLAIDGENNIIVVGSTSASKFPEQKHEYFKKKGNGEAVVMKLLSNGTLCWSTLLGGSSNDRALSVAVDRSENIVVTGKTWSAHIYIMNASDNSFDSNEGAADAFIAKFDSEGALIWSSFLVDDYFNIGMDVAFDYENNVVVVGRAGSRAFISKFHENGVLIWTQFLQDAVGSGIAVDSQNSIIITGNAFSDNFPLLNPYDGNYSHSRCFLTKINSTGTLMWSTFLGDESYGPGVSVSIMNGDEIVVVGEDFNIIKLTPMGIPIWNTTASNCTIWMSSNLDGCPGFTIDDQNNLLIGGSVEFEACPTVNAFDASYNGMIDAFLAKYSSTGSLLWSSFVGGAATDRGYGLATDMNESVYFTGETFSTSFTENKPDDADRDVYFDIFISKFTANGTMEWTIFIDGINKEPPDLIQYGLIFLTGAGVVLASIIAFLVIRKRKTNETEKKLRASHP